jgi:hypothetical protein
MAGCVMSNLPEEDSITLDRITLGDQQKQASGVISTFVMKHQIAPSFV